MSIMVTGGAGYLGSHMVRALVERGMETVVVDNLATGFGQAVTGSPLVVCDLRDRGRLVETMRTHGVDAVVHFAASSLVAESMRDPGLYYNNNVGGTLSLLDAMKEAGVGHAVFSSTAAVYGTPPPGARALTEEMPLDPINAYGRSKRMIETILGDYDRAYGIRSISLRYFNVAGAHASGEIGEAHDPETHLIPLALKAILRKDESFTLYGGDYDTPDGTCIRDYIHVTDLIDAHLLALSALEGGAETDRYNLGSGTGYSNRQVLEAALERTGRTLRVVIGSRRAGDPDRLIASSDRITRMLGWRTRYGIGDMIASAWAWHAAHPNGYA